MNILQTLKSEKDKAISEIIDATVEMVFVSFFLIKIVDDIKPSSGIMP